MVLFLGILTIPMIGCNKNQNTKTDGDLENDSLPNLKVDVSTNAKSFINNKEYSLTATYDDGYFKSDDEVFNKDLAILSLVSSCATVSKENIKKFYEDISFVSAHFSSSYNEETTVDSVAYAFANRGEIVSIAIRGFDYKNEWVNNFKIGLEGNHLGFEESAQKVYEGLKEYLSTLNLTNTKIWLTGYSRGGAIANLLSSMILEDHDISLDAFYGYTFEAPKGVLKENVKEYKNLFNIVNSADLISYLAPEEFGFARHGIDIDIYDANISSLLSSFDEELQIGDFKPLKNYAETPDQLPQAIIGGILKYVGNDENPGAQDRKEFIDNYSEQIGYLVSLAFKLTDEAIENLVKDISKMNLFQLMELLNAESLYNFITPYLNQANISFVSETLLESIKAAIDFVKGPGLNIALKVMDKDNQSSFVYAIYMHDSLATYVLLENYNKK